MNHPKYEQQYTEPELFTERGAGGLGHYEYPQSNSELNTELYEHLGSVAVTESKPVA